MYGLALLDEALRFHDARLEFGLAHVRDEAADQRRAPRVVGSRVRALELRLDAFNAAYRVDVVGLGILADALITDDTHGMHEVVEDESIAGYHEHAVGRVRTGLTGNVGKLLPQPRGVVAQVSHCPSREGRQVALAVPGPRAHEVPDGAYRVSGAERSRPFLVAPFYLFSLDPQAGYRLHAEEGITAEGPATRGFQEIGCAEGIERVYRSKPVRRYVLEDGQYMASPGRLDEVDARGSDHRGSLLSLLSVVTAGSQLIGIESFCQ